MNREKTHAKHRADTVQIIGYFHPILTSSLPNSHNCTTKIDIHFGRELVRWARNPGELVYNVWAQKAMAQWVQKWHIALGPNLKNTQAKC